MIEKTKAPAAAAATNPSPAMAKEWRNLPLTWSRGETGMILDIQNCAPSREKVEEAVPLRQAQMVMNRAVPSTAVTGLAEARRPMSWAESEPLPPPVLPMTTKTIGMRTTESTPFSRKIGVRFMIRSSRRKRARTGRRPPATLRSRVARGSASCGARSVRSGRSARGRRRAGPRR